MADEAEVRTISRGDYYQLLGLRLIADRHLLALKELERAANAITQPEVTVPEAGGSLTADYLWGSRDIDDLLRVLGIEVAAE